MMGCIKVVQDIQGVIAAAEHRCKSEVKVKGFQQAASWLLISQEDKEELEVCQTDTNWLYTNAKLAAHQLHH